MSQFIDKSAIVAKIERLKTVYKDDENIHHIAKYNILVDILSFLDTLEVKENNLVEELDYNDYMTFFKEHPEYNNGDWGFEETWTFGQYCYTLGLKAQKGE